MRIEQFDPEKGLYIFEISDLNTEPHSHPAIEILFAQHGTFTLHTPLFYANNLTFAVIDSNIRHQISADNSLIRLVMIEHHHTLTHRILATSGIDTHYSVATAESEEYYQSLFSDIIDKIVAELLNKSNVLTDYDTRIKEVITYIHSQALDYSLMIPTLKNITHLSESRLSHLFKANVGISLKKYLVWQRLKTTIYQLLKNNDDLFTALIQSGFYDQPHFTKAFKTMLGIAPSKAYNSRIIQVPVANL